MLSRILLLAFAAALSACATSGPSGDPKSVTFVVRAFPDDPAALQRLAKAKLEYSRAQSDSENIRSITLRLNDDFGRSVPTAEWGLTSGVIKRTPPASDGYNFKRYITAKALKTMLDSGHFEYSSQYWDEIYAQPAYEVQWFSVDYAVPMSTYVAEHEPNTELGGYNQRQLISYWRTGCKTGNYAANQRIGNDLISSLVSNVGCHPSRNLMARYFGYLVANTSVEPATKVELAKKLGDEYFEKRQYGEAAGWYVVQLNLATTDPRGFSSDDVMDYFRSYWHPGAALDDVMAASVGSAQLRYSRDVSETKTRLKLIRDAGITQVPAI